MESQLVQRSILAHFDRLVEEGLVVWNDEFRTVNVIDQGVSVRHLAVPDRAVH